MPLILGTNSIKDTGYEVANSVRFENDANSDSFSRDMVTATSRKTFTVSMWLKKVKNNFGSEQYLFHSWQDSNNRFISSFDSSNILHIRNRTGGSNTLKFNTNQKFLDVSAWYNIIIAIDTTQSTESNRFKLYVNGTQVTSFSTSDYPSQNADMSLGTSDFDNILGIYGGGGNGFSGYMCEMVYIDGLQLDPTSFGEFDADTGIWKPIDVSGLSFGSNGFYLDFEDSSSLGNDVSGNGNNFTVNNLTSIDQTTDTCTNNFITWSALTPRFSDITLSEGNCDVTMGGTSRGIFATIGVSSGKWYYESKWVSGSFFQTGVVATDTMNDNDDVYGGKTGAFIYKQDGNIRSGGSTLASVSSLSTGDIVGVYLDLDNSKLYFAKNGTIQNSGTGIDISAYSEYTFACAPTSAVLSGNFGNPTFSITSGNTDPNGYGNFEYSPNDGGSASFDSTAKDFYALNTKNLAEYG